MSDGMGREPAYLSSHATNRYFIPNWGNTYDFALEDDHKNGDYPPLKAYSALKGWRYVQPSRQREQP